MAAFDVPGFGKQQLIESFEESLIDGFSAIIFKGNA